MKTIIRKKTIKIQPENSVEQELTGRLSYCWCEVCKDNSVHRVKFDSIQCIECGIKVNQLLGELKVKKIINELLIF